MANERNIGRIVTVDSLSVYVRLDDDLKSLYPKIRNYHPIHD